MYNRNNNVPFGNYNNQSSRGIAPTRRYSNRLSIAGNVDPYANHNNNPMHAGIQQHMYPRQPSMAAPGLFSSYSSLSYVDENAVPPLVKNNSSSSEETSVGWEPEPYDNSYEEIHSVDHETYNDRSYASSFDLYYSPNKPRAAVTRRTSVSHATYRRASIDPFEYKQIESPRKGYTNKEIEVAPGEFMRLRGAVETLDAIEHDFFTASDCVICQQTILCIADADFLLCPLCKTVSPVDASRSPSRYDCSVGLGFTPADLARWTSGDNTESEQGAGRTAMLRTR